jgi:predicted component of type VI protein secretion system
MKFDYEFIVKQETVPSIALGRKLACLGRTLFLMSHERKDKLTHPIFSAKMENFTAAPRSASIK